MTLRRPIHRNYYPNAKPGEDPRTVKPAGRADPTITIEGVHIDLVPRRWTPDELANLAKWLQKLRYELEDIGVSCELSQSVAYNVQTKSKVILPPTDNVCR